MRIARSLLGAPRVLIGGAIVLLLLLTALLAPWLAPNDPNAQDLLNVLLPPAWLSGGDPTFPLGTDNLGRCLLSRLLYGARVASYVAVTASFFAMLIGTALAVIAGYFRGWVDWLISRVVDVWMSFPPVILSLVLLLAFGAGVNKVVLGIVLVGWTRFCRVLRSEVLALGRRDFVPAARLLGFSHARIILKELLPNAFSLIVTLISLEMGVAVIVEAILSFTGVSVEADVPTWGVMIADGRTYISERPGALIFPALAIFIAVLGFNLLGDGVRRLFDPRLTLGRTPTT
jgi:peptide/nickel transport system permease protein